MVRLVSRSLASPGGARAIHRLDELWEARYELCAAGHETNEAWESREFSHTR
jgi:hypothetical protein